jgi:hypothetical protein
MSRTLKRTAFLVRNTILFSVEDLQEQLGRVVAFFVGSIIPAFNFKVIEDY